jgi:VanZ family protein
VTALPLSPARRKTLAVYLSLQIVAAVGFVVGGPPEDTRFWNGLFDVGHALLFAMLMWSSLRVAGLFESSKRPRPRHALTALAIVLALAGISEVMQRFQPTRHPSFADFLRDAAGAGAVYLVWTTTRPLQRVKTVLLRRGLACTFILLVLAEFGLTLEIYAERDRAFPVLLRFENRWWERQLLSVRGGQLSATANVPGSPLPCARLVLQPVRVPALSFDEPYPDWSHAQRLVFSIVSYHEQTFRLRFRVSDADYNGDDADAFYRDLDLEKGPHQIDIPIEEIRRAPRARELDLTRIRNITLFVWRPSESIDMCLGPLYLE